MDAGAPGRRGFAVQTHGPRGADWPPTLVCLPVHAQTTWVTTAASLTVLCAVGSGRLCLAKHPTMLLTTRKTGSTCSVSGRRGGHGCAGPEVLLRSSRHRKTGTARPPGRRGSVRCTWCRPRGWEAAAPRPRPRRGRREEAGGPCKGSAHSTAPHHEELTQMRPSPPRAQQGGERSSRGRSRVATRLPQPAVASGRLARPRPLCWTLCPTQSHTCPPGAGCAGHRPAQDLGADSSAPLNYISKPRPQDVDQLGVANGLVSSEGFAHIPQGRDRLLQGGLAEPAGDAESPVESADRAEPPFLIWSPQRAPNGRGVPISNLLCAPPHRENTPRPGRGCGRLARLAGPPTPLPSRPRHGSDARCARPSPGLSETQQRRPRAAAAPSRDGTGHSPAAPSPPSRRRRRSCLVPGAWLPVWGTDGRGDPHARLPSSWGTRRLDG